MNWYEQPQAIYWALGVLFSFLVAFWKMAVKADKGKEQIAKVAKNEEAIKALQTEMTNIKTDLGEIKEGVDKQGNDTAAMMKCLQSIMNALYDNDCNIGPARDRFNDYLSDRQ